MNELSMATFLMALEVIEQMNQCKACDKALKLLPHCLEVLCL